MSDGLDVSYGGFSLSGTDEFGVVWRTLSPIAGWDGSPASTLALTQRPRGAGAFIGPRPQMTARTIVLEGLVEAPDADSLQAACDRLVAAVPLSAKTLTITRGASARSAVCYRQDEVLIGDQTDTLSNWSLQVSAPDPRRLGAPLIGTTTPPTVAGGLTIPFTIPFTFATTTPGNGSISLVNNGIVDGPVTLRIDGAITGPTITHINASGVQKAISLPALDLALGAYLLIGDIDSQYVLEAGTTPRDQYLTTRQWFAFEPGVNTFALSGLVFDPTSMLTVTATPAY